MSCAEWSLVASLRVSWSGERQSTIETDVLSRTPTGTVHKAANAKVGVFTCGIDIAQTETKGTVLLKNSEELLNFSRGEEKHMEKVR